MSENVCIHGVLPITCLQCNDDYYYQPLAYEQEPNPQPRRVVQLASDSEFLYALTSDNEIFEYNDAYKEWNKLPPIPQEQDEAPESKESELVNALREALDLIYLGDWSCISNAKDESQFAHEVLSKWFPHWEDEYKY